MKKLFMSVIMLFLSTEAMASTDYSCFQDCTEKYSFAYCKEKCSYGEDSLSGSYQSETPRTDYQCLSDCVDKGYQFSFCRSKCSY